MSLHGGLDTVGIISHGVYTETYGVAEEGNVANVYTSLGFLEAAPSPPEATGSRLFDWFWEFFA